MCVVDLNWNACIECVLLTKQKLNTGHTPNTVRKTADAYVSLAFAASANILCFRFPFAKAHLEFVIIPT